MMSWKGAGPPELPDAQMADAAFSPTCCHPRLLVDTCCPMAE